MRTAISGAAGSRRYFWHLVHHTVMRFSSACDDLSVVPQRTHGSPSRPYTLASPRKPPRPIRVAGARTPVQAAIYQRAAMPIGLTFAGPAIVEQDDTTALVEPGWRGAVLDNGNLLLTRG